MTSQKPVMTVENPVPLTISVVGITGVSHVTTIMKMKMIGNLIPQMTMM